MSLKLIVQVMETVDVPRPQQLVLLAMSENASDDGSRCFPSVELIAWKAGYKPRNVVNIMRELQSVGIIEMVASASGTRPTEYHIRLEKAPVKPTFADWQRAHGRHRSRYTGSASTSFSEEDRSENASASREEGCNHETEGCNTETTGMQSQDTGVQNGDDTSSENAPRTVSRTAKEPSREPSKNHFPASGDAGAGGSDELGATASTEPTDQGAEPIRATPRRDTASGFADWWLAYPARVTEAGRSTKGSRSVALDLWRKLTADQQAAAMAGLKGYVAERGDKPRDAERYLRNRLWRDYVAGDAPVAKTTSVPTTDELGRIEAEIERIRTSDDVAYWGSFGRQQRDDDLALLEAERNRLLGHDHGDGTVAA